MRINFFKLYIGILAAASLLVLLALFDLLPSLPQPPLNLPKGGQIDTAAGAGLALAAVENQRELQHDNYAIYYTPEEFAELFRSVRVPTVALAFISIQMINGQHNGLWGYA